MIKKKLFFKTIIDFHKLIWPKKPFFAFVFYVILILLLSSCFVKVIYLLFCWSSFIDSAILHNNVFIDRFIKDLDMAGMFCGFLGIAIGVIIALTIEEQNTTKSDEIIDSIKSIRDASEQIIEATTNIKDTNNNLTSLVKELETVHVITGVENIIQEIIEIIKLSIENNNNLFILNHSAAFGYYMTFNGGVIDNFISNKTSQNIRNLKYTQIDAYQKDLQAIQASVHNEFLTYARRIKARDSSSQLLNPQIRYGTLNPESLIDSPYVTEYLNKILLNSETYIHCFEPRNDTVCQIIDSGPLGKHYFVSNQICQSQGNHKNNFITHLLEKQKEQMTEMSSLNVEVVPLSTIPVQLFISSSQNRKRRQDLIEKCLFMFVNQQTIGKGADMTAFVSKDFSIIQNFIDVFEASLYQK